MRTIRPILSQSTTNISQLRKNPSAIIAGGDGFPVVVLNRNEPHFYCVPAELYEKMLDDLENAELIKVVYARQCLLDMKSTVEVNIAHL
jgi:antitoxin StbD